LDSADQGIFQTQKAWLILLFMGEIQWIGIFR